MSTTTRPRASAGPTVATRMVTRLRNETGIVRLGLGVIALHVVDDNYLQPQPGTSAGDHVASGLVPLAVLALATVLYPRARAGVRAGTAMTYGAVGITTGVPAVYYLAEGSASGDHYTGPLALLAGAMLLATGPVVLWRSRRTGGSRRRRYLRRSITAAAAIPLSLLIIWLVVFPVGLAYIYTHTGRTPSTPDLGTPFERVAVTTSDDLELTGWYVRSENRAAVVVYPGATRAPEARMLIGHGYGVLLLEARGQGSSEGDPVRWAGDRDLLAGAAFLGQQSDVDPDRIGAIGFSVGGESLLEAAAQSTAFQAVVSEGAGERVGEADVSGPARLLVAPSQAMLSGAVSVFANHRPPPDIVDRIGRIAPRSVFLIYADPGISNENTRQPKYFAAAGQPKQLWKVPGSAHTGGLDAQPAEYERRVVGFFDRALLDRR